MHIIFEEILSRTTNSVKKLTSRNIGAIYFQERCRCKLIGIQLESHFHYVCQNTLMYVLNYFPNVFQMSGLVSSAQVLYSQTCVNCFATWNSLSLHLSKHLISFPHLADCVLYCYIRTSTNTNMFSLWNIHTHTLSATNKDFVFTVSQPAASPHLFNWFAVLHPPKLQQTCIHIIDC